MTLFDPARKEPALLRVGDKIRFVPQKGGGMLTLIRAGPYTSVQDGGREGLRQSGISRCGALDYPSLVIANLLVGNEANAAGLEITLGQVEIEFARSGWFRADRRRLRSDAGRQSGLGGLAHRLPGRATVGAENAAAWHPQLSGGGGRGRGPGGAWLAQHGS